MQGKFTKKELMRANACREFLGVQYLSEIAYLHGRLIRKNLSREVNPLYVSTRGRVKQTEPSALSWRVFYKILQLVCTKGLCL